MVVPQLYIQCAPNSLVLWDQAFTSVRKGPPFCLGIFCIFLNFPKSADGSKVSY
jgi:hypothetical protein